jgi:hypothetical protein
MDGAPLHSLSKLPVSGQQRFTGLLFCHPSASPGITTARVASPSLCPAGLFPLTTVPLRHHLLCPVWRRGWLPLRFRLWGRAYRSRDWLRRPARSKACCNPGLSSLLALGRDSLLPFCEPSRNTPGLRLYSRVLVSSHSHTAAIAPRVYSGLA